MVDEDVLKEKINERKEKLSAKKEKVNEKVDEKIDEQKIKCEERKEKGKVYSEKFASEFSKSVEEFRENFKAMQKIADEKIREYTNATLSNIAAELIETEDTYYLKAAIPGLDKDEVDVEASDNAITINALFKSLTEEIEGVEDATVIARETQVGACTKTVRLERTIDVSKVKAKYSKGIVLITAPKFVIPKHKVTVE